MWGNRKTLNTEHFAEEKVLASVVERIRLGGVVYPWQDKQMGKVVQKQNNESRQQFQQFHNSN